MAQLAISVAGAAAGFAIGGPAGAQWGWLAGSLVGAAVVGSTGQNGPRLSDTKVQISSYGAGVPKVYGGVRVAGNVIWAQDLTEVSSTSGGKGGPESTSYSYFGTFACAISDGVVAGIRKIWFDAVLVYDISETASAETQTASAQFAEYFTWYTGSEVQDPDPTIEAAEGVGNVEAYRGTAYIVFSGVPLAEHGNRIPNVSVETVTDTPTSASLEDLQPLQVFDWEDTALGPRHSNGGDMSFRVEDSSGNEISTHDNFDDAYAAMLSDSGGLNNIYMGFWTSAIVDSVLSGFDHPGGAQDELVTGLGPKYIWLAYNVEPADLITYNGGPEVGLDFCTSLAAASVAPDQDIAIMFSDTPGNNGWGHAGLLRFENSGGSALPYAGYNDVTNNCINYDPVMGHYPVASLSLHRRIRVERLPTMVAKSCYPGDPDVDGIAELPGASGFCISDGGVISTNYEYTLTSGTFRQLRELRMQSGIYTTMVEWYPQGPVLRNTHPDYDNETFWDAEAAAAGITGVYGVDYGVVVSEIAVGDASTQSVPDGSTILATIVSDICLSSGLTAEQIDVSDLTDEVQGYIRPRVMPARAAIEPLRQAFYFDAVENGTEVVFVKRGGASAATITADDLGVNESGESEPVVAPKRAQETELPASVRVAYPVRLADYQTGTQQAKRITTGSQQAIDIEMPIVMTDEKAAEVSDVLMHDAWVGRNIRKFSTTRKWTKLLPTDVVTVNDGDFTYVGQISEKSEEGPVIRWTLRDTLAATYSPNVTPSPTSGGGGEVRFDGPMRLMLMDLPSLRDEDYDSAGFYAVAGSYGSSFRGGAIYKSADGISYSSIQTMNVAGVTGYATTVLGNFVGGNIVDEVNSVTVTLFDTDDTLSGITRAELLNDGGAALLGEELIQYQRVTLVSTATYKLTGLLRGRKGTEQHMGTHAVNDRFAVLDLANVYRVSQQLAEIGTASYKGVANGTAVVDALTQEFDNTAAALKPLSPVHLARTELPSGDYALSWVRRTRVGGAWTDGSDVPLGESTEQYRVRVLDGETVVETQTVTTNYAEVGNHTGLVAEVAQVSSTVGAGFTATVTL